jgi:hypothetical protein
MAASSQFRAYWYGRGTFGRWMTCRPSTNSSTCIGTADALTPGELHDVHELMSDYDGRVSDNWYENAFDELEA